MVVRRVLLKRGSKRSVLREQEEDDARVVKRYHAQGLARFTDRRRALREKRVLERLRALALPAPRTGDVRREADGAWVLPMEDVGERTLASVLESPGRSDGRTDRALALSLGELVGAFLAAGAQHDDPHPGNVVLDASGRPWIVDARGIRFKRVPRAKTVTEALAAMAAAVRERLPARARSRVFAEIWRRLPAELRGERSQRCARVRAIEVRARALRLAAVLENLDRWTRESGACVVSKQDGGTIVLWRRERPADPHGRSSREPGSDGLFVVAGEGAASAWRTAARLFEHGLPVATPSRLELAPDERAARALFELAPSTRPLDVALGALAPKSRALLARRTGELLGAFHDRGLRLAIARGGDLMVSPALEPLVSPLARVDELVQSASARLRELACVSGLRLLESDPLLRRCVHEGYASAFGERAERRAIRADLARG